MDYWALLLLLAVLLVALSAWLRIRIRPRPHGLHQPTPAQPGALMPDDRNEGAKRATRIGSLRRDDRFAELHLAEASVIKGEPEHRIAYELMTRGIQVKFIQQDWFNDSGGSGMFGLGDIPDALAPTWTYTTEIVAPYLPGITNIQDFSR